LVSFDRYGLHLVPCEILRWVVHLGFEVQGNYFSEIGAQNRRVFKKKKKKVQNFSKAHRFSVTKAM
jgi:hypothetical protein